MRLRNKLISGGQAGIEHNNARARFTMFAAVGPVLVIWSALYAFFSLSGPLGISSFPCKLVATAKIGAFMLVIVGLVIVFGSILTGFTMSGGTIGLLIHPSELIIIGGAAFGAFVAGCTAWALKISLKGFGHAIAGKTPGKTEYLELLAVLHDLFSKIHREGMISIEKDIENPKSSAIFQRYPSVGKNMTVCFFIGDTLRTFLTASDAGEADKLMGIDMHITREEEVIAGHTISHMAESLPGMGIVAAVLGIVLSMGKINEPPEVLGESVATALVGTFLGILLCYGVVGPFGAKIESQALEREFFLNAARQAVAAAVRGSTPMIAVEFGRRAIPPSFRPTFLEMEQSLKG